MKTQEPWQLKSFSWSYSKISVLTSSWHYICVTSQKIWDIHSSFGVRIKLKARDSLRTICKLQNWSPQTERRSFSLLLCGTLRFHLLLDASFLTLWFITECCAAIHSVIRQYEDHTCSFSPTVQRQRDKRGGFPAVLKCEWECYTCLCSPWERLSFSHEGDSSGWNEAVRRLAKTKQNSKETLACYSSAWVKPGSWSF